MGYKIVKSDDIKRYGIVSFICDTQSDLLNIPKNNYNPGTRCYCIANKKNYILDNNYAWQEATAEVPENIEELMDLINALSDKVNDLSKKVIYRPDVQ